MSKGNGQIRLEPHEVRYVMRQLEASGKGDDKALAVRLRKTSANGQHACLTPHLTRIGSRRIVQMVKEVARAS